jgi:uncharacterized protein YyaL (SSP411 family)
MMLCALSGWHAGYSQVVIAGEPGASDTRALSYELSQHYLPFGVVIPIGSDVRERLARALPPVAAMSPRDGRAAAFVCRDFTCRAPVTSAQDLSRELSPVP